MKRFLAIAAGVLVLASVLPASASGTDEFIQGSRFCDSASAYRPGPAVADGPANQLDLQTHVFEPAYASACRLGSGLVTFLGTGDRAGIDAILNRRGDRVFGTADIPLSAQEYFDAMFDQTAPDRRGRTVQVNQIPLFVTVESVGYNLSSCHISRLNLRSPVLSAIFSGTVTRWNDRLLVQDNAGLATCNYPIRLVKRAGFAGSSFTFKDYLSKRNPQWNYYKQPAQNASWPTITNNCPALDDDAVAECIATTANSIGYLQYHSARLAGLRTAYLDTVASEASTDPAQTFIAPSPQGCTAAAASTFVPPALAETAVPVGGVTTYYTPTFSYTRGDWSSISLTDARQGYPMCSFGYAFVYQSYQIAYFGQQFSTHSARTAVDYLWVALADHVQAKLAGFDFGMLPANVLAVSRGGVSQLRYT